MRNLYQAFCIFILYSFAYTPKASAGQNPSDPRGHVLALSLDTGETVRSSHLVKDHSALGKLAHRSDRIFATLFPVKKTQK